MNAKKILVAILGIATTATWGPQVLDQVQSRNEPQVVYPEADEVGSDATVATPSPAPLQKATQHTASAMVKPAAVAPLSAQPSVSEDAEGIARGGPSSGQLGELLDVLNTFAGDGSQDLGSLLDQRPSWLEEIQGEPTEEATSTDVQSLVAKRRDKQTKEEMQADTIESFLDASPLTAIVQSKSDAWAMIGGRIVREGDVLLPKLLKVATITTRGVTLRAPSGELSLPLPAFQVQMPSSSTTSDAPEVAAPDTAMPAEASSFPSLDPS